MQAQMTQKVKAENQERGRILADILAEARHWLMGSVRSRVPLYEDAEDIVQDVLHQFTGAFDDIRTLEASSSWLYQAARNRISDFYRKRGRTLEGNHQRISTPEDEAGDFLDDLFHDPSASVENRFDLEELEAKLEKAILALPPDQRDVFVWHEIDGRSFQEIQKMTGVGLNTLLSRKRYAIQSLRKQLKEYDQ